MAETEVSKEVSKLVAVEEKCGLDLSSYQDLPKPDTNGTNHHNQANDLDNSYVFVTGADGVPDCTLIDKGVVVGGSGVPPQPEDSQNKKLGEVCEEAQHLNVGENGKVEHSNGDISPVNYSTCEHKNSHEDGKGVQVSVADSEEVDPCKIESLPEAEVRQVEESNGIIEILAEAEGFQASVAVSQEVHTDIPESVAEANVKQVEDANEKCKSMPQAEVEKTVDQNGELEGVTDGEQENFDGVTIAESPPCPVENQESQVGALGLVAEIGENIESDNIFSSINSSTSTNDGENLIRPSVTEALEQQRSQDLVVEAEDETKPTREVPDAVGHEVSTSTSQRLDSESFSVDNMDKIPEDEAPEEEAQTDLSSKVLENQQGDSGASNLVQDMVGETDESKPEVSITESHVQISRDLVLEENEDSSVSEVENGVQYHEESHECVASSTDTQVLPTSDLASEDKNENISVSEIEDGVKYQEESQEQPVISSIDSQVQTTYDLVLEENHENTAVSEIEDGVQYHEESQEQPLVSSADSQVQTTCDLILEEKNNNASVSEVEDGVQYDEESQEQPVVSSTESEVLTTYFVFEEKNESVSVSEVEGGVQYPEETPEQSDGCGASHDITPSETIIEASIQTQSDPMSNAHAPQSETEVSDVEDTIKVSSPSVVGTESQTLAQVVPAHDSPIMCAIVEASTGSDCVLDMVIPEKEISFEGGEAHSETKVSSGKSEVGHSSQETLDVKVESEGHVPDFPAITSGEKNDGVSLSCRTEISDSCNAHLEGAENLELEVDGVEDVGDKLEGAAGDSKENLLLQEKENTENSLNEETSVSSAGVSMNISDGEDKVIKVKTKPFNFLIRTPRFDDENLREQIRLAKLQIDEKTKLRDAIQLQIQEKRQASSQNPGIDYEYAKNESRIARKLVRAKRTEIDSLQSVINKAKNASSIEDIDNQIHHMEHMIQHETLPLKEEKQFIREIKQLKQLREQLSSNMGSQDEIKQALQQREEVEGRLKILRKELDVLKSSVLKVEATAAEAGKKYDDENRKVKELQAQFRAANDVRQEAYAQWQNLRKELSQKSEYFFKYMDDAAVASNYAFSRDTEALFCLCTNQVESFMELWNKNPEFRRDYVKFNTRSNIRRFGTLDCRSLGPDEKPLALPSYADERGYKKASKPVKVDPTSQIPSVELNQKTPSENVTLDSELTKKVAEPKNQKLPNVSAITVKANGLDTHSGSHLTDEVHEEPVKSRDEIESIRKAEEKRREEAEAKLKEQRRLEALAKANEARERKKRQAEKMQQRAELKIQKEAEQREKEREKRLRKKERKKAAGTDTNDTNNSCETAASSESAAENSRDMEVKETGPATGKKPQKPWLAAKQSKAKSIPPPLRNRNKKKLQQWMWVGMTSFIILVLFWMGNIGVFSNVALKRRAPFH